MRSVVDWLAVAASASLLCCGGGLGPAPPPVKAQVRTPAPVTAATAVDPPRDDGRLPALATPEGYTLNLTIDPSQARFTGVDTILVNVPKPTPFLVLNGRGLTITRAKTRSGSTDFAATVTTRLSHAGVVPDELVLAFASPLPAGSARIEITYDAPFAPDLAGLYRVKEDGRDYAYTQFEATDARRAFPGFDEPGYKSAFDITIAAPRGNLAFANSPEVSQAPGDDGMVVHTFRTTAPLPTYLVAFAVGPFDVLNGPGAEIPIRVITTRGRAPMGRLALDVAGGLLAELTEYFGVSYPYPKLDLVAVPDFDAGAMENPGLITFRDTLLLVDADRSTTANRRAQAEVVAHELAHQWFGDLVTMRWWDDLWLNEGFATWAEAKAVDAWKPAFGATMEQIAGIGHVMDADSLRTARAVRQPVRSTGEAMEAFDGITYEKGAAILRMLEGWLGPDTFRRGIHRYLQENAWKNAGADDLFQALDFVSTRKVEDLAGGFLDQSGVPEVLATVRCGEAGGNLELQESEWRPLGEAGDAARRRWTLPVCVASDVQKNPGCFTLGADPIERSLGNRCPTWVYPNAGLAGYYRFVLDRTKFVALAHVRSLEVTDRLGLLSNAWAGVRQGVIEPSTLLDILPTFDAETNRFVMDEVVDVLGQFDDALVEDATRPAFKSYVKARLAANKRALGWETSRVSPEDDGRKLERSRVLGAMGDLAGDSATLDEADRYATRWLADPSRVSNDIAAIAVPIASIGHGAARLLELRSAARTAKSPEDRVLAIRAMGMFDDPAVLRDALDLTLTDEIKLSEMRYVVGAAQVRHGGRNVLYAWEKDNWGQLRTRLTGSLSRELVDVAGSACTAAARDDAKAFFVSSMQSVEGSKRPLDEALEQAELCVALREHAAADVTTYLAAWRKTHPD